jgi:aspartyl-tRNA(Asn)/glutamyl-tRNA(Gln) amidotransferase subunit C
MSITHTDTEKLAKLARLKLSPEEVERFTKEMDAILAYVGEVTKIATGEVKQLTGVNVNTLRQDEPTTQTGVYTEKLLSLAPESEDGYVVVKKIL